MVTRKTEVVKYIDWCSFPEWMQQETKYPSSRTAYSFQICRQQTRKDSRSPNHSKKCIVPRKESAPTSKHPVTLSAVLGRHIYRRTPKASQLALGKSCTQKITTTWDRVENQNTAVSSIVATSAVSTLPSKLGRCQVQVYYPHHASDNDPKHNSSGQRLVFVCYAPYLR